MAQNQLAVGTLMTLDLIETRVRDLHTIVG